MKAIDLNKFRDHFKSEKDRQELVKWLKELPNESILMDGDNVLAVTVSADFIQRAIFEAMRNPKMQAPAPSKDQK